MERVLAFIGGAINVPGLVIVLLMLLRRAVTSFEPEWPIEVPSIVADASSNNLARGNAMRNPQRTASTASALMIGLALVTLVAVLAAGLKSTFESAVNSVFSGDYALTATDNFSPISDRAVEGAREGARRVRRLRRPRRRGEGLRRSASASPAWRPTSAR